MKIGIFDSGLGGLSVTKAVISALPQYDYCYLGDTARVPYGNRSQATVYQFTEQAIDYLFKQDCGLIIIACNTASAEALRQIQQQFLPAHYPDRKVLGVIRPTVEEVLADPRVKRVGVIATRSTVASGAFERELKKIQPSVEVIQQAAPLLVPLIENNGLSYLEPILANYLQPILAKEPQALILGSTHYSVIKDKIRAAVGPGVTVFSEDEIIPAKLTDYLNRHPEVESRLTKNRDYDYQVTDQNEGFISLATQLYGEPVRFRLVSLEG